MKVSEQRTRDLEWSRAGAGVYDEVITPRFAIYHEHLIRPYLDALVAKGVQAALDVGCGTGHLSLALARRGIRVTGVDHSDYMLDVAKRRVRDEGLAGLVSFVRGDAAELPFDDESFDLVTCQRVLHHLPDYERAVAQITRVASRGCRIYLCEPTTSKTPAKRLIIRSRRLRGIDREHRRAEAMMQPARDEGPVDADHLLETLARLDVHHRAVFLTQIGSHRYLPEPVRWALIRTLSWPWRSSCGDLVFIFAEKRC